MRRIGCCGMREARTTGINAERNEAEGARNEAMVSRCGWYVVNVLLDVMSDLQSCSGLYFLPRRAFLTSPFPRLAAHLAASPLP